MEANVGFNGRHKIWHKLWRNKSVLIRNTEKDANLDAKQDAKRDVKVDANIGAAGETKLDAMGVDEKVDKKQDVKPNA